MSTATTTPYNFNTFVGGLEAIENDDRFVLGDGQVAFSSLQSIFSDFSREREAGNIGDEDWAQIEDLAAERATQYRGTKGEFGRFDVLQQYSAGSAPQGEDSNSLREYIEREKAINAARPDAVLFRDDLDYAFDHLLTSRIREEENPDGSFAPADYFKRVLAGAAGTTAMAVDQEGDINANIQRWLATDPARDEEFMGEVSQGLGSIGASMAVFAAGTGLTKNPMLGGSAASLAFNGMVRYNEGYQKAKDYGAPDMVASKAGMYSTPAAFVDVVGDMIIGGRLAAAASGAFRVGSGALPRNMMLNRLAYQVPTQAIGQAASEVGGDLTAAAAQSQALGDYRIFEEELARAPRTAAVSAVLGGMSGAITGGVEARDLNRFKALATDMGVRPEDLIVLDKTGKIDPLGTNKRVEELRLEMEAKATPDPEPTAEPATEPSAEPEPAQPPANVPEPQATVPIKTWADAFRAPIGPNVSGTFDLTPEQEDQINQLGDKADELVEQRDELEKAGAPAENIQQIGDAINVLVQGMVDVANTTPKVDRSVAPQPTRIKPFRTRQEAQARIQTLKKLQPQKEYSIRKEEPADGSATKFFLDSRDRVDLPDVGETIARAREIENLFKEQDFVDRALTAMFGEPVTAEGQTDELTFTDPVPIQDVINDALGISPEEQITPVVGDEVAGPFESGSELVSERQSRSGDGERYVARKKDGQWYLHKTVSQPGEAELSAQVFQDDLERDMQLEEFGEQVEREFERKTSHKFRVNKRKKSQLSGSILLPDGRDIKQAVSRGIEFFSNGIQDFGSWSQEMVREFGDGIREYLSDIWESIREGVKEFFRGFTEPVPTADQPFVTQFEQMIKDGMLRNGKVFGRIAPADDGTVSTKQLWTAAEKQLSKAEMAFLGAALRKFPSPDDVGVRSPQDLFIIPEPGKKLADRAGGMAGPDRVHLNDLIKEVRNEIGSSVRVRDLEGTRVNDSNEEAARIIHEIDTNSADRQTMDAMVYLGGLVNKHFPRYNQLATFSDPDLLAFDDFIRLAEEAAEKESAESSSPASPVTANHILELQIFQKELRDGIPEAIQLKDKFNRLNELQPLRQEASTVESASALFTFVNPKPFEDTVGLRDIVLVDPSQEQAESETHFTRTPENVLAFTRTQEESTDENGDTLFLFEVQSDRTRDRLAGASSMLVSNFETQMLKIAIDKARREGKKYVAVTDAETAMMTEGHDQNLNEPDEANVLLVENIGFYVLRDMSDGSLYNDQLFNTLEEAQAESARDLQAGDPTEPVEITAELIAENSRTTTRPDQEKGMQASYGDGGSLHKRMQKLTGSKGKRVDYGTHQNGPSPVFTKTDGTPKDNITAIAYPIDKLNPNFFTPDGIIMRTGLDPQLLIDAANTAKRLATEALQKSEQVAAGAQPKEPDQTQDSKVLANRLDVDMGRIRSMRDAGASTPSKLTELEAKGNALRAELQNKGLSPELEVNINRFLRSVNGTAAAARRKGHSIQSAKEAAEQTGIKPQPNIARPSVPEAVDSSTPLAAFKSGWKQGVQELRDGVANAADRLKELIDESKVKDFSASEVNSINKLLSRRNLTLEDTMIIEEKGEAIIEAAKHRDRLTSIRGKQRKAKKKATDKTLGIKMSEATTLTAFDIPATVWVVNRDGQPADMAKALLSFTPAELALVEQRSPGFLDKYEEAMDLIMGAGREPLADTKPLEDAIIAASESMQDIAARRSRTKISRLQGLVNKAAEAGDDVSGVDAMAQEAAKQAAEQNVNQSQIADMISFLSRKVQELPTVAGKNKEQQEKNEKRLKTATQKAVAASKEFGRKALQPTVRALKEDMRHDFYKAFSDLTPEMLDRLSVNDIEALPATIQSVSDLFQGTNFEKWSGEVSNFTTRMMTHLGARKLEKEHQSEIEEMHSNLMPSDDQTQMQRIASVIRNNPFVRYITEQQSADVKNLTNDQLRNTFGFLTAQNLLFVGDQLGADGLVSSTLAGTTDHRRQAGLQEADSLFVPIKTAINKLKTSGAKFEPKVRKEMVKKGILKTSQGLDSTEGLNLTPSNIRQLDLMNMVQMAFLVKQLDTNNQRDNVLAKLNTDDPMLQWIEGGYEKTASARATSTADATTKRLLDTWDAMTTAAGGNTWGHIAQILTPEQVELMNEISKAMNVSGAAVKSTSAIMRNTRLQDIKNFFPMMSNSEKASDINNEDIVNALIGGVTTNPVGSIRPSSSHLRKSWVEPQLFDLEGIVRRHLSAVMVDNHLTSHLAVTNKLLDNLKNYERLNNKKTTSKWQSTISGLQGMNNDVAGISMTMSDQFMSGAHRGISAAQQMMRRAVLAQIHKPLAEMVSLGWIFGNRIGIDNYASAVREHAKYKPEFMMLMHNTGSSFMTRAGWNSADMQVIDRSHYTNNKGLKLSPSEAIKLENSKVTPSMWGWMQDTTLARASNWATRWVTSVGDHAASGPAMYHLFMKEFQAMTGQKFSWKEMEQAVSNNEGAARFAKKYDSRVLKEAMLKADVEFQKMAAPNTAGLVSALRNQSSKSALTRFIKGALFPFSHFAANEKSNFFKGLRRGFGTQSSGRERLSGFHQAFTHAMGNTMYQIVMYNMGKMLVGLAGGAMADALDDEEGFNETARRMQELGEELTDPETYVLQGLGGMIDTGFGGNDPLSRGLIGYTINKGGEQFRESVMHEAYDPYEHSIVYVRDIGKPSGMASYLVGPYSKFIEDFFRAKSDIDYLLDDDKKGASAAKAIDFGALMAGYAFGLPAQTTINKITKDAAKSYSDPDYKLFNESLKTQSVNANVKLIVDRRGNSPAVMASYIRSLDNVEAAEKAMRHYKTYAKQKNVFDRDTYKSGMGALKDLKSR